MYVEGLSGLAEVTCSEGNFSSTLFVGVKFPISFLQLVDCFHMVVTHLFPQKMPMPEGCLLTLQKR